MSDTHFASVRNGFSRWFVKLHVARTFLFIAVVSFLAFSGGCSKEHDFASLKVGQEKMVEAEAPGARGQGTVPIASSAVPKPESMADSGCEKDCAKFGYCVMKDGNCGVGRVEHCQQSTACREVGMCSISEQVDEGGKPYYLCKPMTDQDCKKSEGCRTLGKCKVLDGFCTNQMDPATQKYRNDQLADIRKTLFDLTKDCEDRKQEVLKIFRETGIKNPALAWAKMEGVSDEVMGLIAEYRSVQFRNFQTVHTMVRGDKELLGFECSSSLRTAAEKALTDCIHNARKQDIKWILSAGVTECSSVPTSDDTK